MKTVSKEIVKVILMDLCNRYPLMAKSHGWKSDMIFKTGWETKIEKILKGYRFDSGSLQGVESEHSGML